MIKNDDIAKQISDLMLDCRARLDKSVELVMNECEDEDFQIYRSAVGEIMGAILLEVLNPLYRTHPELKPKELR